MQIKVAHQLPQIDILKNKAILQISTQNYLSNHQPVLKQQRQVSFTPKIAESISQINYKSNNNHTMKTNSCEPKLLTLGKLLLRSIAAA